MPIRIVRALQRHTALDVHLVDLQRWDIYEHDVVYAEDPTKAQSLAEAADIVHLYSYLDYENTSFAPVNFEALRKRGTVFVRQFSSHPGVVASALRTDVRTLLASPIPALVTAQFHERYYPDAYVVPLVIPQDDTLYRSVPGTPGTGIVFSPSEHWLTKGAWDDRWNTKAAPETWSVLEETARRTGVEIKLVTRLPLTEALALKRACSIVVDELVTGSYHVSGLEGLSLSKPVLAYLDARVDHVLREISGSRTTPFVNVRLEDALEVLVHLAEHPAEAADIGASGRAWLEMYWSEARLAEHYVAVYRQLLEDPTLLKRQPNLSLDPLGQRFFALTQPDLQHAARAGRHRREASLLKQVEVMKAAAKATAPSYRRQLAEAIRIFLAAPAKLAQSLLRRINRRRSGGHAESPKAAGQPQ